MFLSRAKVNNFPLRHGRLSFDAYTNSKSKMALLLEIILLDVGATIVGQTFNLQAEF